MGFRQPKSHEHERQEAWRDWLDHARSDLRAIGLPPEVFLSEAHWRDFLTNGYLEKQLQDSAGFDFDQLSPACAGALRRFLEAEYAERDKVPPLLGWLRVRHSEGRIA